MYSIHTLDAPLLVLVFLLPFGAATTVKCAPGPLRVHPTNPRYFTDGTKCPDGSLNTVYLTGSHTWANLIDRGPSDPPPAFDFDGYLRFLVEHHQNFIRLWGRQVSISNEGGGFEPGMAVPLHPVHA